MSINWNLPIETIDIPPRPAKVLFNDPRCKWIVVEIENEVSIYHIDEKQFPQTLRNVPSKPSERWANWYQNGAVVIHETKEQADKMAADKRIACRKIAEGFDES